MTGEQREQWIRRSIFTVIVLVGFTLTFWFARAEHQRYTRQNTTELHDQAVAHVAELQALLDLYVGTNRHLAAFIGASRELYDKEFQYFVRVASPFRQLPGLLAVGYLPRVRTSEIPAFEQRMHAEFPNYRVWGRPFDTNEHYPLAYAANPQQDQQLSDKRRGLDYASVIERREAILRAFETGKPQATYAHIAAIEPAHTRVVLLFTPITADAGSVDMAPSQPQGIVYSVLRIDSLFDHLNRRLINTRFHMQVYEETIDPATLLHTTHTSVQAYSTSRLVHKEVLSFGGMNWLFQLSEKKPLTWLDHLGRQQHILITGIVLSLLTAWGVVQLRRRYWNMLYGSQSIERFASFFETHPFIVFFLDRDQRFTALNKKAEEEFGVSRSDLTGQSIESLFDANNRAITRFQLGQALRGEAASYHCTLKTPTGQEHELSVVLLPIALDGHTTRILCIAKNVTEEKMIERELHRSRTTMQSVIDTIPQLVFWKALDGTYQGSNRSMLRFSGLERPEDLIGKRDEDMPWQFHADRYRIQDNEIITSGQPLLGHQELMRLPSGKDIWLEVNKVPMQNLEGDITFVLGVVEDITQRKEAENELAHRANYDALTNAANRSYFYLQLDHAMHRYERYQRTMALLYFDIDEFKSINDTYGHSVGDAVIKEFTQRVQRTLRASDLLARLGGDEFIVLAEEAHGPEGMLTMSERILAAVREPFVLEKVTLQVYTSIGIAFYQNGMTADRWVNTADQALYKAKRTGRNRCVFAN